MSGFTDEELEDIQSDYQDGLNVLTQREQQLNKDPDDESYKRSLEKAYVKLREPERKFQDAINTLLVDCLEAVVTADKDKQTEKFGQLARFGKVSGFTNAEKMERIGAARGKGGGERYAHRR
jgi:hypothetical protein